MITFFLTDSLSTRNLTFLGFSPFPEWLFIASKGNFDSCDIALPSVFKVTLHMVVVVIVIVIISIISHTLK